MKIWKYIYVHRSLEEEEEEEEEEEDTLRYVTHINTKLTSINYSWLT